MSKREPEPCATRFERQAREARAIGANYLASRLEAAARTLRREWLAQHRRELHRQTAP